MNNVPRNSIVRWYVYPHTPTVNEMIASALTESSFLFVGELRVTFIGGSVKTVPIWEVPRFVINALRTDFRARGKYTVFAQRNNGDLREFDPKVFRRVARERRLARTST